MVCVCRDFATVLLSQKHACSPRPFSAQAAPSCHKRWYQACSKPELVPLRSQNSTSIRKRHTGTLVTASLSTQERSAAPRESSVSPEAVWSHFCENVSGEWEGATATFTVGGQPQELPSQYVPKEFSDWDVTLYDWQSQCSMQPQATGIKCLLKRLMPTVGCEADAQSFHEDKRQLLESSKAATQHAILSNGSYTTASTLDLSDQTKLRFEHWLVTDEKKRIRLVQHITAAGSSEP